MEFHKAANIFPMLTGDEYRSLVDSIRQSGLQEPIWTCDGMILDGRNRYTACLELGIEPQYREYTGDSPYTFVINANIHRRHLTSSQRAMCALEVEAQLAQEAKKRQGARTDIKQIVAESSFGQARDAAASLFTTNRQYVTDAKRIFECAPELAVKIREGEMTIPEAKRIINRQERVERIQELSTVKAELDIPERFPIIYADPPWRYEHSISNSREIENHYPTMELSEICALSVNDITTDDAVLFLWATSPKLAEALEVMEAWGFSYRTCMVWAKDKIGMGYYARQKHELLLIGARGNLPTPEPQNRPESIVFADREEHSKKPVEFYEIIERMYSEYPKVELFARNKRKGWYSWGNQV